jgi:hypothetical protein
MAQDDAIDARQRVTSGQETQGRVDQQRSVAALDQERIAIGILPAIRPEQHRARAERTGFERARARFTHAEAL